MGQDGEAEPCARWGGGGPGRMGDLGAWSRNQTVSYTITFAIPLWGLPTHLCLKTCPRAQSPRGGSGWCRPRCLGLQPSHHEPLGRTHGILRALGTSVSDMASGMADPGSYTADSWPREGDWAYGVRLAAVVTSGR